MGKRAIPVVSLLILFAAGGYLWWIYGKSQKAAPAISERVNSRTEEPEGLSEKDSETSSEADVEDIEYEVADLVDVSGHEASGSARRRINEESMFEHGVIVKNLQNPGAARFYEGWLVRSDPVHFISTGIMDLTPDGSYELKYESDNLSLTDYPGVVITLEEVDDGKPEVHILEGSF